MRNNEMLSILKEINEKMTTLILFQKNTWQSLVNKLAEDESEDCVDCNCKSYKDTPLSGGYGQWYHINEFEPAEDQEVVGSDTSGCTCLALYDSDEEKLWCNCEEPDHSDLTHWTPFAPFPEHKKDK